MVALSREAIEICTEPQLRALFRLYSERVTNIQVSKGNPFDLPEDYLSIRIDYSSGSSIYGGISPEGDVST